jgi:hypothetical protein
VTLRDANELKRLKETIVVKIHEKFERVENHQNILFCVKS